jgi:hypothetical protein
MDDERSFLDSVLRADEDWCFQYDPQTKRQSIEWRSPSSPRRKQKSISKVKNKVNLVIFFDSQGIIHKEFVPPGQTVNKEYYVKLLSRLVLRIRRVRPQFQERGSWFFLHDNAGQHTAVKIRQFLVIQETPELNHSPYSPHLSP